MRALLLAVLTGAIAAVIVVVVLAHVLQMSAD
jgi:hypothetical protein